MRLFLPVAFALLAGAFWLASGGSAFDPPERTAAAPRAPAPAAPAVPAPAPLTQAAAEPEARVGPADAAAFDRAAAEAERTDPAPSEAPSPAEPPASATAQDAIADALDETLDLRTVTGSVVNMRAGPGTGFDVVGQLTEGARAELLSVAGGWSEVRTEDGTTGWMASRFLQ